MSSSARLKYKIVKCTSEDPEYPASELLAHSSQTKGWQTARFCDFPQEIGLQFETPVHLRQVQFLSHQSKIATKVELFTALPSEGQNCRYEAATFKRLGYLSLDSNERSQFQARELKSVYVDVSAQFLRIVLHKCHVNRYNIVNQVGLIALHCSGEVLGPDLAVGPPPPNPALARSNAADNAQAPAPGQRSAAAPAAPSAARADAAPSPPPQQSAAAAANASEQAQDAAQAAADEMRYDERTLERIRALTTAKQRAVEAEDYEEAKRCKEMLTRLRQTGQLLRELEERKRAAVQNEDYDAAKALKVEIDKLRSSIERPQNANDGRERGGGRASPTEQMTAPRGAHQPSMAQAPVSAGGFDNDGPIGGQRVGSQSRLSAAPPESPLGSPHAGNGEAAFGSDAGGPMGSGNLGGPMGGGPPGGGRAGGSSPTMNSYNAEPAFQMPGPPAAFDGGGAGESGRASSPPLVGMQGKGGFGGNSPGGRGLGSSGGAPPAQGLERERSTPSEAAHHLRGVPNVEDILTSPEPLSAAMEKDKECELLLQLFGDYITRCIFSKTWNLRDAALQKLALDLREGARGGDEPSQLLQGYSTILKRTIADKNIQVMFSSGGLLQAVAQVLLENGPVRRNEAQAALDPLMPLLVERLGEPNARVDKTARDALLDFARCQSVGATFTTQYLLRSPKKKTGGTVHARVFSSRLAVITALVTEFGVQPDGQCPLEATMQLAMEWFNNKDEKVRENSVKLAAACHMHVGLRRIEGYLANLRPAQREVFDAEFERAMASPNAQGQGGGRAQASARGGQRHDDGGDGYGGLPPPAVPPPRRGPSGGGSAVCPPATGGGYHQEEAEFDEQELEEFTCQFCGRQDPSFTPEALDVHYWRECPMLIQCEFCQQVIEISTLRGHLCEECEAGPAAHEAGRAMLPHQCPLCRADVGEAQDEDWKNHLLVVGCPANPRSSARGRSAR